MSTFVSRDIVMHLHVLKTGPNVNLCYSRPEPTLGFTVCH